MYDTELSCVDFVEKLASKTPTPGGGGAAALVGALAAALCAMVGNYTIGKKKYADVEEIATDLIKRVDICRSELIELVRKDAEAFESLVNAYSYPMDSADREEVLEKATIAASQPPLQIVRVCEKVCKLLEEMGDIGSKMLISDVGCGAYLCLASMESAALNVFINTRSMKNRDMAKAMEEETEKILTCCRRKTVFIVSRVEKSLIDRA